jgi:hypothetical protein
MAFPSSRTCDKAARDTSSMQTWTNSQPTPRLLLWPVRSPVRWPTLSKRPSFDIDLDHVAGMLSLVAMHRDHIEGVLAVASTFDHLLEHGTLVVGGRSSRVGIHA